MAEKKKIYIVTTTEWSDCGYSTDRKYPDEEKIVYFWDFDGALAYLIEEYTMHLNQTGYVDSSNGENVHGRIDSNIGMAQIRVDWGNTFPGHANVVDIVITSVVPK